MHQQTGLLILSPHSLLSYRFIQLPLYVLQQNPIHLLNFIRISLQLESEKLFLRDMRQTGVSTLPEFGFLPCLRFSAS